MATRIDDDIKFVPADHHETLSEFLMFLAVDLEAHPERIQAMDTKFQERLQRLTDGIDLDLEQALQDDDEWTAQEINQHVRGPLIFTRIY
jgi:hypothetical protein